MEEAYVSLKMVAEYMSVCRKTVERYARNREFNKFPCHRVGGQWRFKISEIELWIQRETMVGGKEARMEKERCVSLLK